MASGPLAPALSAQAWRSATGAPVDRLTLADLPGRFKLLYFFQSWCPGCHSHGFPTLATIKAHFEAEGRGDQVAFVAVQTVFEGFAENTEAAATESLERHGLTDLPLGHDAGSPPTIMADYRTGGTPWTLIIGPDRTVLADGFQVNSANAIDFIESLLDAYAASSTSPADSLSKETTS